MLAPFDIFRVEDHSGIIWIESAPDLKTARRRISDRMRSRPGEYVILSFRTGNRISVRPITLKRREKPSIFQVAYDSQLLVSREKLLKSLGCSIASALGNTAAKEALKDDGTYDLFLIGHSGNLQTRKEMVDWLKAKYPAVKILALNPPDCEQLPGADFNLRLNGPEEWLMVVEGVTGTELLPI